MPDFSALQSAYQSSGADAALTTLADQLRSEKKYHELFEALKMRVRSRLGMALLPNESSTEELSEPVRQQLEDGLVAACREVGELLFADGKAREGWMYYRPVGDKARAAELIALIEPDEDNYDDLIEVMLHEGVDTGRGYQLLLDRNGVCNAITLYDQVLGGRPKKDRQPASAALLTRLHGDLIANVTGEIARQEGTTPSAKTLRELLADREWLFQDGAYHIDTTHLGSVVRLSRVLENPAQWRMALDLTEYGRRLSEQLQYQGDEPFAEQYPSHAYFYQALLGENVEEALAYFKNKAEMLDPQYHGTQAVEVYLELLSRTGRHAEALKAALELMPENAPSVAYAPQLLELCAKSGDYTKMAEFCKQRGDALGFVAALTAG